MKKFSYHEVSDHVRQMTEQNGGQIVPRKAYGWIIWGEWFDVYLPDATITCDQGYRLPDQSLIRVGWRWDRIEQHAFTWLY